MTKRSKVLYKVPIATPPPIYSSWQYPKRNVCCLWFFAKLCALAFTHHTRPTSSWACSKGRLDPDLRLLILYNGAKLHMVGRHRGYPIQYWNWPSTSVDTFRLFNHQLDSTLHSSFLEVQRNTPLLFYSQYSTLSPFTLFQTTLHHLHTHGHMES